MDVDTVGFNRGFDEMKPYEKEALKAVKAANGDYYSEDDYKKLKVSSQWLKHNASHEEKTLDVIFRITCGRENLTWYELAIRQADGKFAIGGYLPAISTLLIVRDEVTAGYHDLGILVPYESGEISLFVFVYTLLDDGSHAYLPRQYQEPGIIKTLRRSRVTTLAMPSKRAA